MKIFMGWGAALILAWAPGQEAEVPEVGLGVERARILELAERFASVRWRAEERHAFHGEDERGVRIDTPDAEFREGGWTVGEENVGMPYAWGGFTSLEGFEEELAAERYAGHVPVAGRAMASDRTVGVDCSGLVSHCWSLPLKQSTRSLGALSYELADYDELEPGDIVNAFDAHTALFVDWADAERTTMNVIEAGGTRVRHGTYTLDTLRQHDFRPMRYKLLDARWQPMPTPDPDRDTRVDSSSEGFVPTEGVRGMLTVGESALERDPLPAGLRHEGGQPGAWVRYATRETRLPAQGVECTWMEVRGPPERLDLQRFLTAGEDTLATGVGLDRDAPWAERLASFAGFSNPLRDLEVTSVAWEEGTWSGLPARRIVAAIEGSSLSRSTLYPVRLSVTAVISDAVPLFGLCEASFNLATDYGTYGTGSQKHRYTLTAYGHAD